MRILFRKQPGARHDIVVRERRFGPDLRRVPRETGPTIPHDLAHAAVEEALELWDGFWAAVDRGVVFDDFRLLEPSRARSAGAKQQRRYADRVLPAELSVSWAHRVWSGQRSEGRGLGSCPLTSEQLRRACAALDRARARWDALAEGESLEWVWSTPRAAGALLR